METPAPARSQRRSPEQPVPEQDHRGTDATDTTEECSGDNKKEAGLTPKPL